MTKEERLDAIIDILKKDGSVQIRELVDRFNVADMTIRRDFDLLVSKKMIVRTHGGAVLAEPAETPKEITLEPSYGSRVSVQSQQKKEISRMAVDLLSTRQNIFLDSGSTTLAIAKAIAGNPDHQETAIITNGINIAFELLLHQHSKVITLGGEVNLNTWSTRGSIAETQIDQFHADIAFLGCNAISPNGDAMIGNLAEISLKQKIISISNKIYLVADSSKFGHYSLSTYANVRDFDGIITDHDLPENLRQDIRRAGGKLLICSMEDDGTE